MTDVRREISLPLDNDFLRRQCPLCRREFKAAIPQEELHTIIQQARESFLLETTATAHEASSDENEPETEFFCPYCGQQAPAGQWWTEEQVAYFQLIVENIRADLINKDFIRPHKRTFPGRRAGSISTRFEGRELPQKHEWLAPEPDDMTELRLPCCECRIKVQDDWSGTLFCFFCGFPHIRLTSHDAG